MILLFGQHLSRRLAKADSRFALTIRERYDFAMSAILKDEDFVTVEAAVKAGVAPQPVASPLRTEAAGVIFRHECA